MTGAPNVTAYTDSLDCVHCGLCLSSCPTYDVLGLETDSPRGRIYLMRALAEGRLVDPQSVRIHLDQCLGCRACETACPSGVRYGRILETVRGELEEATPSKARGAWLRRTLLRRVVAHRSRLRLAFALGRLLQLLRLDRLAAALRLLPRGAAMLDTRIPPRAERRPLVGSFEPDGPVRGRVALFTGCVMEQMFGHINRATLELLLQNGFAVDVPETQACCGALLLHDGQVQPARELAERNLSAFAKADVILNNSAGCGAALKEYDHLLGTEAAAAFAGRCRDVCEFLAEQGLTATPATFPHPVAYDDPCHLCHGQGVRAQPRELLSQVPGLELVAHRDPETCCGSAGIYNLVHPEIAEQIGQTKAEALVAAAAPVVATGNPGCMMQIRAHLAALGSSIEVVHPVELLLPKRRFGSPPRADR